MSLSTENLNFLNCLNSQDENGNTPLHYVAEFYGEGKIWSYLIKKGGNIEIQNLKNLTPLDLLKIKKSK